MIDKTVYSFKWYKLNFKIRMCNTSEWMFILCLIMPTSIYESKCLVNKKYNFKKFIEIRDEIEQKIQKLEAQINFGGQI